MEKYKVRIEAERFIHNDLSNCANWYATQVEKKFESEDTTAVALDMMSALIFTAFSIEAKINFVGWKLLEEGWPERANLKSKIKLLAKILEMEVNWGERPFQTIYQLKKFRDTIAHGKPEIIDVTKVVDVEPEVWATLKGQWEASVNKQFVVQCREDEKDIWEMLLGAAGIEAHKTLTRGGHYLTVIPND
ncbi:hypothetical protein SAMN05444851_2821 [Aliiroseovarius sediminilitoris]|uniref:Uncharacterized protein n=1 Tax=Aliiroseovarius sediminilitoris TaxID=1173584 RepID=A0A1I0QQV8_9RHOB|nr:hypothetical protein [Aliiroseovarius sediminilitoris]SEW29839.1 hypothetical protein SAMN05444851_2821 [Aliiroseovarius sediminilitoris]